MAAATVNAGYPRRVVNGNMNEWIYQVSAANTNTLDTPLKVVKSLTFGASAAATAPAATLSTVSGKQRITFALSATDTLLFVRAMGW